MSQNANTLDAREKLAEKLKAARKANGVQISALAEAAKVARQTVYDVEAGHERAPVRLLRVYAKWCDLDPDLLLLSWGYVPDDVFAIIQRQPEICKAIRARELLKSELSQQS